jgi:DNA-binding MarR family transcriptional regulator
LIRAARRPYINAVRSALAEAEFDDVPRNGAHVIAAIALDNFSLRDTAEHLGVTKQSMSQLIDTLVIRGYVTRAEDQTDRRRLTLSLTPRGTEVAKAVREAVTRVNDELAQRISATELATMRKGLGALVLLGMEHSDEP